MKCVKVCNNLIEMINNENVIEGCVHSIFSSTINILVENRRLVSVIKSEKSLCPYSVLVECDESFLDIPIKVGDVVYISKWDIKFRKIHLKISKDTLDLSFKVIRKEKTDIHLVETKIKDLKKYLLLNGNRSGILSVLGEIESIFIEGMSRKIVCSNSIYENFASKVKLFIGCLSDRTFDNLSYITSNLVGFGIGLTPSSDDFLCGIMAALLYGSSYTNYNSDYFLDIFEKMVLNIENRTTLVSENFLINSSKGVFPIFIKELCSYLFSDDSYEKIELYRYMNKVLSYGETSGSDILCGIYIGTIINKEYFIGSEGSKLSSKNVDDSLVPFNF